MLKLSIHLVLPVQLRYQKCLDAHPEGRMSAESGTPNKGIIGATIKTLMNSFTLKKDKVLSWERAKSLQVHHTQLKQFAWLKLTLTQSCLLTFNAARNCGPFQQSWANAKSFHIDICSRRSPIRKSAMCHRTPTPWPVTWAVRNNKPISATTAHRCALRQFCISIRNIITCSRNCNKNITNPDHHTKRIAICVHCRLRCHCCRHHYKHNQMQPYTLRTKRLCHPPPPVLYCCRNEHEPQWRRKRKSLQMVQR